MRTLIPILIATGLLCSCASGQLTIPITPLLMLVSNEKERALEPATFDSSRCSPTAFSLLEEPDPIADPFHSPNENEFLPSLLFAQSMRPSFYTNLQ
jgi:hypothetical protein